MLSNHLISLDDFGAAQLFEDKTYIVPLCYFKNEFKKDLHIQMLIPLMICGWENRQIDIELNNSSLNDLSVETFLTGL